MPKIAYSIRIGLVLVAISSTTFLAEILFPDSFKDFTPGGFFIHYGLALTYLVVARNFSRGFRGMFRKKGRPSFLLFLVLCNISAYSLNTIIPVFHSSVGWLVVFLLLENLILVLLSIFGIPKKGLSIPLTFFVAVALLFNIYQSFIVLPWSMLGVLGVFILGFSLLLFVPLFYVYGLISILRSITWSRAHYISFGSGILVVLLTLSYPIVHWRQIESQLSEGHLAIDAPGAAQQLPDWISVVQTVRDNSFFEDYLKADLVYQKFAPFRNGFSDFGTLRFSSPTKHDPLVSLSGLFVKNNILNKDDKIKILNYLYDTRHESGERFWSGANLATEQVVTNVELFPTERLSFTEMILTISNNRQHSNWWSQQEALYTFQLPEGGIVTSLSLWIEGEERKAILTSKKKAKKAYDTIVGKEARDPSVVYWMEGNKIRVRIFPCTPKEKRKFKLGITAPLELKNNELKYHAITFNGPTGNEAKAAVNIVANHAKITESSFDFNQKASYVTWRGDYQNSWTMSIEKEPFSTSTFHYKEESFKTMPTVRVNRSYNPEIVFLDLNSHWTENELKEVLKIAGDRTIITHMTTTNKPIHSTLPSLKLDECPYFSLFPFYEINDWRKANEAYIIVTKSGRTTPNLTDLSGSRFAEELFDYFSTEKSVAHVIDLADRPSDYLRSLHELNVVHCTNSSLEELANYFSQNQFPTFPTDASIVEVPLSNLSIAPSNEKSLKDGSNHLMRLYYYQKVMNATGRNYFLNDKDSLVEEEIVDMAVRANIVTPLSSLIVLETQKDYDRFGIKRNKDSLGNAAIGNSGAVPEPHEWALIIVGIVFLSYVYLMSRKRVGSL